MDKCIVKKFFCYRLKNLHGEISKHSGHYFVECQDFGQTFGCTVRKFFRGWGSAV